mmetsp:Transcript_27650/g.35939  ORF Transcript_27650/g.35939 Transcript_27650/m.35939 type:complete len:428 (+) Transcript_27650:110-1393(+)
MNSPVVEGRMLSHPHHYEDKPLNFMNPCYWHHYPIVPVIVIVAWVSHVVIGISLNLTMLRFRENHFFATRSVSLRTFINIYAIALNTIWISLRFFRGDQCEIHIGYYSLMVHNEMALTILTSLLFFDYWVRFSDIIKYYCRAFLKLKAKLILVSVIMPVHFSAFAYISQGADFICHFTYFTYVYFGFIFMTLLFLYFGPVFFRSLSWRSDHLGISKELLSFVAALLPLIILMYVIIMSYFVATPTTSLMLLMNLLPTTCFITVPVCRFYSWHNRAGRYFEMVVPVDSKTEMKRIEMKNVLFRNIVGTTEPITLTLRDSAKRETIMNKAKRVFCDEMVMFLVDVISYKDHFETGSEDGVSPYELFKAMADKYIKEGSSDELNVPWYMKEHVLKFYSEDDFANCDKRNVFDQIVTDVENVLQYNLRLSF